MPIRPTSRSTSRAGVLAAAAGAVVLLLAPAASAAPSLTIPLDPSDVYAMALPGENYPDGDLLGENSYVPVEVQWNGTVTVSLPAAFDGSEAVVTLALAPDEESEPTKVYSTDPDEGDPLIAPVSAHQVQVTVPADDATDGPSAMLLVDGLTTADGIEAPVPVFYGLTLGSGGAPSVTLAPTLLAFGDVCELSSHDCDPYEAAAGSDVAITLPKGSSLRALGFTSLADATVGLISEDDIDDWIKAQSDAADEAEDDAAQLGLSADTPTGASNGETPSAPSIAAALAQLRAAVAAFGSGADDATATSSSSTAAARATDAASDPVDTTTTGTTTSGGVFGFSDDELTELGGTELALSGSTSRVTTTLPEDLDPGYYSGTLELTSADGGQAIVSFALDVQKPKTNDGLSSATGWNDAQPPTGSWPLIALGATALALAGGGSVLVLRRGR